MAADANLPESVRDSRWEADFEPNPHVPHQTTNTLGSGRRLLRQEIWERQRQLGHGGFGVVWLERTQAADQSPIRLRAVKELQVSQKDSRRREYIRELQALVKFSQQKFVGSFVEFYYWYESNNALFIAMEYCQHGDLRQFVKDHGAINEIDVQKITDQVLQGLILMHENKFAHRDLKPANILIQHRPPDNEWKIKIGDMGLSKRIDVEATFTTVRGTPGFMAPERILPGVGSTPSATDPFPCDMWCLGEVVFFLLTSKKTFDSLTKLQKYYNDTESFPEQQLRTAKISQQAIDFIKALMAAQPNERLSASRADDHSWMRDTGSMTGPQRGVSDRLPSLSYSSASRYNDPAFSQPATGGSPPTGKVKSHRKSKSIGDLREEMFDLNRSILQETPYLSFGQASINIPPRLEVSEFNTQFKPPSGAVVKGHRKSRSISEIEGNTFNRSTSIPSGHKKQEQKEKPSKKYPPISMLNTLPGRSRTSMDFLDSRKSFSFDLGNKHSSSILGSQASAERPPNVGGIQEKRADPPLHEHTIRGITVPSPPRYTTDTRSVPSGSRDTSTVHLPTRSPDKVAPELPNSRQGTPTIPSGTWNSSITHPVPESQNDDESAVVTSADQDLQKGGGNSSQMEWRHIQRYVEEGSIQDDKRRIQDKRSGGIWCYV
ncbi:kinase-like domain-containing protein [Xylaria arbuscula]|nr:kinase-like domain-containing protein [Xylaria arbuscula]